MLIRQLQKVSLMKLSCILSVIINMGATRGIMGIDITGTGDTTHAIIANGTTDHAPIIVRTIIAHHVIIAAGSNYCGVL